MNCQHCECCDCYCSDCQPVYSPPPEWYDHPITRERHDWAVWFNGLSFDEKVRHYGIHAIQLPGLSGIIKL